MKKTTWYRVALGVRIDLFIGFGLMFAIALSLLNGLPASAAQTVPYKMNLRGSLNGSTGTPVADGLYNMKFRIYDAASAGALQWTEVRETTNRVQVTGGLFSVQLGDVTSLPLAIFTNQNLFFEVEMASPATATCASAGCASYTEGPMTPRNKLAAAAYALNADTVDGIDGASLARNNAANTFTSANTFNANVVVGSTNSATKFVIQNSSSVALLTADTSATIVRIGTTAASTLTGARVLSTNAEFTGAIRIGTAANGADISTTGIVLSGSAQPQQTVSLIPEYAGATFSGDGSNNAGSLSSDFCSGSSRLSINAAACGLATNELNYYEWTNTNAAVQDYDLYVRYAVPADYAVGSMSALTLQRWGAVTSTDKAHISMYNSAAATLCSSNSTDIASNATWQTLSIAAPLGSCVVNPGDTLTFKVHVEAGQNRSVRVGEITFKYKSRF